MRVAHRFPRCSLSLSLSPSRPAPSLLPPRPLPARCSHCQHFAPKYARAAAEVSATHPEVQFHAVSCVAHGALCRDQNVTGYPTVRVYRGGSYEGRRWGGGDDAVGILRELGIGDGDVGYTCGLWQLFHVVSVGAVEYNRNNPPMPTRYVADTLRNCECASRRELFSIFPPGRR